MRVLVTGSRDWANRSTIYSALTMLLDLNEDVTFTVVHGGCPTGADRMAHQWAENRREYVTVEVYEADWEKHDRAAGPIRNGEMVASRPDVTLAFIKDGSRGATDCLRQAQAARLTHIYTFREDTL